MENRFPFFLNYIFPIQIEKVNHTNPKNQATMNTFRMEHAMFPYIYALGNNLPRRQIRLHHRSPYRFHTAKQHHIK